MQWYKLGYPVLLAVLAGAFIPVQTGANTFLSKGLGNLTLSTWVVFVTASLATLLILLLERPSIPPRSKLKAIPWFAWLCGGVLGSGYIPKTKWFESFSLAPVLVHIVAKPRRNYGFAYVLRLVDKHMDFALTFPNHFALGISTC